MKYNNLVISTRINDRVLVSFAANRREVNGIIIGDPFCLARARIKLFDIPRLAGEAKRANLLVSYRTPVYLTSRNLDNTVSLIESMVRDSVVDEVRIQDIGLLHRLQKISRSKIKLTWSIYGSQREFPGMDIPINQAQVDFLKSKGIQSFEVTSAVAYSILTNKYPLDFNMQVYHYKYDPVSFSRRCYTEEYAGHCRREFDDADTNLPCDEVYYLQDEEKKGMKYVMEGHRILEFPDPEEFRELIDSNMEIDTLVLEGNEIGEINDMIGMLTDNG
ncbi:MAG: hypothetical protein K8T10_03575 [Candidatus Eremiobacteraeota bacterium]|nr:hypothetical protein [Candidatus Eremiobacteraeota bacterium]